MKIYKNLQDVPALKRPILTIGTFDGVHKGHVHIIRRLVEEAESIDGQTVMLTFFPHPRMVLFPEDHGLKLLNTPDEKAYLLQRAGINHLVTLPFSSDFSRMTPFNYIRDILVNALHVHKVVVGYDHHFGRNREGTIADLKEYAEMYHYQVEEIAAHEVKDIRVSSTKIRKAITDGNVTLASFLLGYDYMLSGMVTKGDGIGRKIQFPTANIVPEFKWKLIPGQGVYACRISFGNQKHVAMVNIGTRPTVSQSQELKIEAHILDWEGDLYDQRVTLEFVTRIREERTFDSVDSLARQLMKDKEKTAELFR
ncbi:MAG: bifunctional riboflavin kinase/FAD synthetase [Flavobacteriales bacterium]|nr:bifunctional riboflavin kinase/FAD synthetase [Flavobacteriales bacterium]